MKVVHVLYLFWLALPPNKSAATRHADLTPELGTLDQLQFRCAPAKKTKALRTHILRCLGPKTMLYRACLAILSLRETISNPKILKCPKCR